MKTKLFAALASAVALSATVGALAAGSIPGTNAQSDTAIVVVTEPASLRVSASTGCPTSGPVLLKALGKSAAYKNGDIASTKKLTDVDCYRGYAVAVTVPKNADGLTVVFRYSTAKQTWKLISYGSDGFCVPQVPASVRRHLTLC
jgi:hypothetical protein